MDSICRSQKKFTITKHQALLEFHPNPIRASVPEASIVPSLRTSCKMGDKNLFYDSTGDVSQPVLMFSIIAHSLLKYARQSNGAQLKNSLYHVLKLFSASKILPLTPEEIRSDRTALHCL